MNDIVATVCSFLLTANLSMLIALFAKVNKIAVDLGKVIQKIGGIE